MKEFLSQFSPIDLIFTGLLLVFVVTVLWAITDLGHALDLSDVEDEEP